MKTILVGCLLWLLVHQAAWGQQDIREGVYVHLNAQNFVSGETLYFSAYCNSQLTGQPSQLSKILYVELIGNEGAIHQQKVQLEEGRGHGEFFISSVVPSGQYYLVAYTRWMKNFGDYFQAPVLIINPYEYFENPDLIKGVDMHFSPHDSLVSGIENEVAFQLKANDSVSYTGRLVNGAGQEISKVSPDKWGIGSLTFTPKVGEFYQVILSDATGQVTFHQLPPVKENGHTIQCKVEGQLVKIIVKESEGSTRQVQLAILSGGDVRYETGINTNEDHRVAIADLNEDLLCVRARSNQGGLLVEKWIYLGERPGYQKSKSVYPPREQVRLDVALPKGTYSVSVRRTIDAKLDHHNHAVFGQGINAVMKAPVSLPAYLGSSPTETQAFFQMCNVAYPDTGLEHARWLPEFREEIVTGTIRDSAGTLVKNQLIALSFPDERYQLRVGKTNSSGKFAIPFQSSRYDHDAVITAIQPYQPIVVEVDDPFQSKHPDFDYQLPYLDSALVAKILARSVRSQIENAYYLPGPVALKVNEWPIQFTYDDSYYLDNYERFPTLKETFIEYIVSANVRNKRDEVIQTTFHPGLGQGAYPPLVLLDGVPVKGKDVIDFNPRLVGSVKIVLNRYFLGPLIMDGVVDIATRQHHLEGFSLLDYHYRTPIMGISQSIGLRKPDWLSKPGTQVPDQRDQLLWVPLYQPEEAKSQLSFTTSDVCGEYELVVEGFDFEGKPVSKVTTFAVR